MTTLIFDCHDCGVKVNSIGEYAYMVKTDVWAQAMGHPRAPGLLCIGCLEHRLGRRLVPDDFHDCPLTRGGAPQYDCYYDQSDRLKSRLRGDTT